VTDHLPCHRIAKRNLRRWLSHHKVRAHRFTIGAERTGSWCSDLLSPTRYVVSMSSALLDEVALAMGIETRHLLDPDFDPASHYPPEWYFDGDDAADFDDPREALRRP